MRINNNISAVNTLNALSASDGSMSKSLEKLSSGLRITRASDDAAGLAISEKMRNQVKGLNQARTNAQDGISMIQTAEGALNETHSILSRMRELTVQASNDTLTDDDRGEIQKEMNNLTDEVDRISTDTEFNTKKLLNGNASTTAKKATGMNTSGDAIGTVSANSTAQAGTYQIKFNNSQAAQAMGTITRTGGLEADLKINSTAAATAATVLTSTVGSAFGATSDGTFSINGKQITVDADTDSVATLLNKINNSGAGVGASWDATNRKINLYADKDAAADIKISDGTSDLASKFQGWSTDNVAAVDDDNLLTGATAGSVRLTNLQGAGDQPLALQTTDVISISGKVNGQDQTSSFTVGTSTVQDLLTNIGNTFGGATATLETQRTSSASTANDFSENLTMDQAFNGGAALTDSTLSFNGTNITIGHSDTLQDVLNKVNAKTSETGISASLDRDSKTLVFSSANNITMDISSTGAVAGGTTASVLGLTTGAGAAITTADVNRLVIKGADGASNAITDVQITATNDQGNTQRSVFDSNMSFTQTQVARDKGDFVGVAQLNTVPDDKVKQSDGVAVKLESANTQLIKGVSVQIGSKISTSTNARDTATVTVGQVDGSVKLQIGANKGQSTTVSIEDMGATALGLKDAKTGAKVSVMTREDAQNTLTKIDKAISKVSTERSKLGAVQNRLEHTITNLGVSSENMTAAESRIRDLDMASEMSNFTKNQILQQAGTAMMSQANQKTQGVLRLLG